MALFLTKLAEILARTGKSRAATFGRLTEQLAADVTHGSACPVPVTLGNEAWEYAVIELGFPGGVLAMRELSTRLLLALPVAAEFTFITHTLPLTPMQLVVADDDSVPGRLSQILQPTPNQTQSRIRSYLLLRVPLPGTGTSSWLEDAHKTLAHAGIPSISLPGKEAAALLQDWCGPKPEAAASSTWACQVLTAKPRSRHPLQSLRFDAAVNIESWDCVSFGVNKMGDGFVHRASSAILKGEERTVMAALSKRVEAYHNGGFSVVEMHRGPATEPITQAMTWLAPLKRVSSRSHEPTVTSDEMLGWMPLPIACPDTVSPEVQPFALATHNNLGVVTHLRSGQSHGPGHTLVMGHAGSGLTYLGNAMLAAHLRGGGQAWALRQQPAPIFDEVAEGHVVNLDRDSQFSVNPLSGLEFAEDLWNVQPVLVSWLAMLASLDSGTSLDPGHDDWCRYWLTQALEKAWSSARENLGLAHVLEELDYLGPPAQEISQRIRSKVKNMPSSWFEGVSSTQSTAHYVSVSPAELDTPEQEVVAATVLVLHYRAIVKTPRAVPKLLLIDEAGILGRNAAQGVLMLVLRSLRAENAVAVICEHPFPAGREDQSPLERVLDEYCDNKILTSTVHYHCWRDRLVKCLGYEPQVARRHNNNSSRFLWVQEAHGSASMLELELSPEAQVAFSAWPWQHFSYKEARTNGVPVMDALKQGALARAPYEKGTRT